MNNLTPEQLDMIKRLQPLFREKMGEWQKGDSYYVPNPHKREDIKPLYYFGCGTYWGIEFKDVPINAIRIPKPIDWQNPKRGCWMMVDWSYASIENMSDGSVEIYINRTHEDEKPIFIKADPFTALLMALCSQEGV